MEKIITFAPMKRLGCVLVALLCLATIGSKAQVISPTSINSGEYYIGTASAAQKMLQWKPNVTIIMDDVGFYMVTRGSTTLKYVDIPSPYNVLDFAILGDSLYFCGNAKVEGVQKGYIAYIKIDDLFAGNLSNYSFVTTTTSINKIKVYYNEENGRIVAGIGQQRYADPPFINLCPEINCPPNNWFFPSAANYDCLIIHKVGEWQMDIADHMLPNQPPVYVKVNSTYIYNVGEGNPGESFRDIALTENYICLFSTRYAANKYRLVLRRFDKNDFAQLTNETLLGTGDDISFPSKLLIESLDNDNVALTYLVYNWNAAVMYSSIVTKIDVSTTSYNIIHSSLISSLKAGIIDVEYVPEANKLLVLQDDDGGDRDHVYYVNMDDGAYNYGGSYGTNYLDTKKDIYNSLCKLPAPSTNYVIIGGINLNTGLRLLDKNITNNAIGTFSCYSMKNQIIYQQYQSGFQPYDDLKKCFRGFVPGCYICPINTSQMQTSSEYPSFINTFRVSPPIEEVINTECLTN